jgi:hypothetical protein
VALLDRQSKSFEFPQPMAWDDQPIKFYRQ